PSRRAWRAGGVPTALRTGRMRRRRQLELARPQSALRLGAGPCCDLAARYGSARQSLTARRAAPEACAERDDRDGLGERLRALTERLVSLPLPASWAVHGARRSPRAPLRSPRSRA